MADAGSSRACIGLTTCPDRAGADALARGLVEQRLAACVQLSEITSTYRWRDKIESEPEIRLLLKTVVSRCDDIERFVRASHPYELPEWVWIEISGGSADFLAWIHENSRCSACA